MPTLSTIVQVALHTPSHSGVGDLLSYASEHPLAPGTLVRVPLGTREVLGVVWDTDEATGELPDGATLRPIAGVLDGVAPLDLFAIARLDFQAPDEQRFPCLRLARQAAQAGGTAPAMLNAAITPVVYEYGSLGCSGDLAPLSHCALALMGEGEVFDKSGKRRPTLEVLKENNIKPIVLREKEGLALINGTDGMLGMLLLAITDLFELCKLADIATALSVEALLGTDQVFTADMHEPLRAHPGQVASAANIFALLKNSPLVASHRTDDTRVQDAYSLRCAPQVNGAVRDTITHALNVAQRELAAMIDNPVVTSSGEIRSNGNFHGAPVGYVLDFLAIATCDLGSISERRTDRGDRGRLGHAALLVGDGDDAAHAVSWRRSR